MGIASAIAAMVEGAGWMATKHVLVVDDDPGILEIIARAFELHDLRVTAARRVSVAKTLIARNRFDLVLTDARMPGETGLELAEMTRALGIATIVMSGDPEWAAAHGLAHKQYLAKPFEIARLVALVKAHTDLVAGAGDKAPDLVLGGRGRDLRHAEAAAPTPPEERS